MKNRVRALVLAASVLIVIAACSPPSTVTLSKTMDDTQFNDSQSLTVPATTTAVMLSGTVTIQGTGTLEIIVIDPDNTRYFEPVTGDGTGQQQTVNRSFTAVAGGWILRAAATGVSGSFSLRLQY